MTDAGTNPGSERPPTGEPDAIGAEPPAAIWKRLFPMPTGGIVKQLEVCAGGTIVLAGSLASSVDFGGGPIAPDTKQKSNGFVAGLDSSGAYRFAFRLGTAGGFGPSTKVQCAPNGDVIVAAQVTGLTALDEGLPPDPSAETTNQILVARLDSSGRRVFLRRFGNDSSGIENVAPTAVAVDAKGAVILAARYSYGAVDFGGGLLKARALVKLDAAGAHVFSRASDYIDDLATSGEDIIELGGSGTSNEGKLQRDDPSGTPRWQRSYTFTADVSNRPLHHLAMTPTGEIYAAGRAYSAGSIDIGLGTRATDTGRLVLAKIAADGQPVSLTYFGNRDYILFGGRADSRGDYLALFHEFPDDAVVRVRANGEVGDTWRWVHGPTRDLSLESIALGPADEVFIGGAEDYVEKDNKVLVMKLPAMP